MKKLSHSSFIRAGVFLSFIAAWVIFYHYIDYSQYLTKDKISLIIGFIRDFVVRFGIFGPIFFIAASCLAITINVPTIFIICFSVITFGEITGAIISAVAVYIATTLIYFIAQMLGTNFVEWLFGDRLKKFEERLDKRGLLTVVYLRLIFFMSPVLNWLLGITNISYKNFFFGTLLGTAHNIILTAWLSGSIIDLIKAGDSLNPVWTPKLFLPFCIGATIFLAIRIIDRRQRIKRTITEKKTA